MRWNAATAAFDPEMIANTTTQGAQFRPGIAATGNGAFIVAWQGNSPSDNAGIYAQRFGPAASYVAPSAPQIGIATATVTAGLTLTAANVVDPNIGGIVVQVAFYRDANGDGILQPTDLLLGFGTQTSPGMWTYSTNSLASGTYTFFAQALDNYGVFSAPIAITVVVP